MEQHKTIAYEGTIIHYREEGREYANTLVLLHGYLQNLDVWTPYLLSYMRSMHVITIDLPGHGYSGCHGDCHTMEFMADAVHAVLEHQKVRQCVMVGHSMGGYVALAFAEKYPFLVKGLGLLHSHAFADTDEKRELRREECLAVKQNKAGYILNFVSRLFTETNRKQLAKEVKDLSGLCLATTSEGIIAAQNGMAQRPSHIGLLEEIVVPVLFVYGKSDPRISLEIGLSQAMLPACSQVLLIDDVAHMSFIEKEGYVKQIIRQFVENCYL